jgi:hypothetical protein
LGDGYWVKINGFDAQRFERLVESVRTITTGHLSVNTLAVNRCRSTVISFEVAVACHIQRRKDSREIVDAGTTGRFLGQALKRS